LFWGSLYALGGSTVGCAQLLIKIGIIAICILQVSLVCVTQLIISRLECLKRSFECGEILLGVAVLVITCNVHPENRGADILAIRLQCLGIPPYRNILQKTEKEEKSS